MGPFDVTAPLDRFGLYAARHLPDDHWLCVQPLTFGRAQLGLAPRGKTLDEAFTSGSYIDVWDYESRELAVVAMEFWDGQGEPTGWIRHPASGRRQTRGVITQGD